MYLAPDFFRANESNMLDPWGLGQVIGFFWIAANKLQQTLVRSTVYESMSLPGQAPGLYHTRGDTL